jgi:hypothetical protein
MEVPLEIPDMMDKAEQEVKMDLRKRDNLSPQRHREKRWNFW